MSNIKHCGTSHVRVDGVNECQLLPDDMVMFSALLLLLHLMSGAGGRLSGEATGQKDRYKSPSGILVRSFDAESTPKKSASLAAQVGDHCYFSNKRGTPKHKEIVIDTTDHLRKRNARPDFKRICHMLYPRHGLSQAEVQNELNLLVDSEAVVKRDYNGNTSYRNATKRVTAPLLDIKSNIKPCRTSHVRLDGVHEFQLCTADRAVLSALLLLLLLIPGLCGRLSGEATAQKVSIIAPVTKSSSDLIMQHGQADSETMQDLFKGASPIPVTAVVSGTSNGFLSSEDEEDHVLSQHGHLGQAVEEISRALLERHVASQAVWSTFQKAKSTRKQPRMPPLTRRFATPMFGHKAGCSMERRKANDHFDSAERRLLPLNQADNKLQKDRTSQIKTDDVHLRQNGTIDTFSPMLFEEANEMWNPLARNLFPSSSFDAECTPKKSVSPATLVGAHCYFFNVPGTPVHKEIVLDTIDQWRKSKARPGFERICHMLYQRHDLSKAVVQEELNLLVDYEAVIKVDYKDNTSYRNAAKWVTAPLLDIMGNIKSCGTSHVRVDGVHECQLRTADIVIFLALLLLLHLISGHRHLSQAVEEITRALFERHIESQAVCSTFQKDTSTKTQPRMPPLTRRVAAPMVGHKVGCSMEKAKRRTSALTQWNAIFFRSIRLFDAESTPKKSASPAADVGDRCYFSNMRGTPKHKEIVHDTIYQLRKRKAWPDFERICHMLYQRHGLSQADVQEELNLLVNSKVVVIKDYNGNTSYHNATKWGYVDASQGEATAQKVGIIAPITESSRDILCSMVKLIETQCRISSKDHLQSPFQPLSGEGDVSSEVISSVCDGHRTSSSETQSRATRIS
ncbi:hypothetical protein MRX96_058295 [Rhipicephalus microplus]